MKRQPGRPPLDAKDPSVPLTVSLPSKQLAAVTAQAKQDRLSSGQEWIRRVIRHALAENKST